MQYIFLRRQSWQRKILFYFKKHYGSLRCVPAVNNLWYQMDGTPAHGNRAVGKVMEEMFGDHWMAHNGP